jgi:large subunit ribosomal protein L18e
VRRVITNTELIDTIRFLKIKARENKAKIWSVAANQLSHPRRSRAVLNLNHVSRFTKPDSLVFVAGKLLGSGVINHRVVIGAFEYSQTAREKVEQAGGQCMAMKDFVTRYPTGSNVTIMR